MYVYIVTKMLLLSNGLMAYKAWHTLISIEKWYDDHHSLWNIFFDLNYDKQSMFTIVVATEYSRKEYQRKFLHT